MIWCFIKFFEKEEYADAFVSGLLYLNTLKYFRDLESASDDGRADSTEAVSTWLQPHDVKMTIKAPGFEDIHIDKDDLAGPVSFTHTAHDSVHLFCLYAIHSDESQVDQASNEWRRHIELDPRCLGFGKFAVIVAAGPLLEKLKTVLPTQGHQARGKLVRYYDDSSFHGEIPTAEIPFMKQQRFGYQREFRLCIYPRVPTDGPLAINIGDLSSICRKMASAEATQHWIEFRTAKNS